VRVSNNAIYCDNFFSKVCADVTLYRDYGYCGLNGCFYSNNGQSWAYEAYEICGLFNRLLPQKEIKILMRRTSSTKSDAALSGVPSWSHTKVRKERFGVKLPGLA
jgi:hypothetical protein